MADSARKTMELTVGEAEAGLRLDRFLAAAIDDLSRQRLKGLIETGEVWVDDALTRDPALKVKGGAVVRVTVPPAEAAEPEGEAIALAIVYEDPDLIVIDKPAGLVVHPAPGNDRGTLVNALIAHCGAELSGIGGVRRPGIVHRLDKDTSGLLVVAKTDKAHQGLSAQFQAHGRDGRLVRAYVAFAWGAFDRPAGVIDRPLVRSPINRRKIAIARPGTGRRAVTHYAVEAVYGDGRGQVSRLELRLETGRTHQIRVHLSDLGHPLLGDLVYGAGYRASEALLPDSAQVALKALGRQALHAAVLGFEHPRTGETLSFSSPLPPELEWLEATLGQVDGAS